MASTSSLRSQGNQLFQKAVESGLSNCLRRYRLQDAIQLYKQARAATEEDLESSMCNKNISACCYRLAMYDEDHRLQHLLEGLKYSREAIQRGAHCQATSWIQSCTEVFLSSARDYVDESFVQGLGEWMGSLQRVLEIVPSELRSLKVLWCVKHARMLAQHSISLHEQDPKQHFRDCLRLLNEASRPLQLGFQALRAGQESDSSQLEELEELQETVWFHTCSCESVRARQQADHMLSIQIECNEQPNMGMVWLVVDKYKEAIILSKGIDIEMEAMAASQLGHAFDKVLLKRDKAGFYFRHTLQLAESLKPKIVTHLPWYQVASRGLQRFQREAVLRDEKEEAKRREPMLQALKSELSDLSRESDKGAHTLLQHIYSAHAPKNPEHVLTDKPNANNTKELLKQAIRHYHPDKQNKEEYGETWVVLCEEIVKTLTNKYQYFKC